VNDGSFSLVGTLSPGDYGTAAYQRTAGIVDVPVPPGTSTKGQLALRVQNQYVGGAKDDTTYVNGIAETANQLSVQTDQRGVYVDQGGIGTISFDVLESGAAGTPTTVNVVIAQYVPSPLPPAANAGAWQLVGGAVLPVASFVGQNSHVSMVTRVELDADGNGQGSFSFTPLVPGFPTFVFFPYLDTDPTPVPPSQVGPVAPGLTTMNAFYACGRNMPFDDALPQQFAQLWNGKHSQQLAYDFVDQEIFGVYALIYPTMAGVVGSMNALVNGNQGIQERTSPSIWNDPSYMPVTRELSAGKRKVIEMWGQLVDNNFNPDFNFPQPATKVLTP
jgi:hypothetical protein